MSPAIQAARETREYLHQLCGLGVENGTIKALDGLIAEASALHADRARLDWLDAHCEVMASTNCAGTPLVEHNAFLNPDHGGRLRGEIDEARAVYPVPKPT